MGRGSCRSMSRIFLKVNPPDKIWGCLTKIANLFSVVSLLAQVGTTSRFDRRGVITFDYKHPQGTEFALDVLSRCPVAHGIGESSPGSN